MGLELRFIHARTVKLWMQCVIKRIKKKSKRHKGLMNADDLRFQLSLKMKYTLYYLEIVPVVPFMTG